MYLIKLNEGMMDYYIKNAKIYGMSVMSDCTYKYVAAIIISIAIFICYVLIVVHKHNTFIWKGGHLLSKLPIEKMIESKEEITRLIAEII